MEIEQNVRCKIIGIKEYGMFVSCGIYEGLVHISEISDQYIKDIKEIFSVDDYIDLCVLEVDEKNKRLKLSYKKNHHINGRILKHIPIKKGFHSLNNELPKWIDEKRKKENEKI